MTAGEDNLKTDSEPIEETLIDIIMNEIGKWTLDELCHEHSRRDLANRCQGKVAKVIDEHVTRCIQGEGRNR